MPLILNKAQAQAFASAMAALNNVHAWIYRIQIDEPLTTIQELPDGRVLVARKDCALEWHEGQNEFFNAYGLD